MSFYSMLFFFVQTESLLTAASCSLEVSNRTTPVDSKYVSHFSTLFLSSSLPSVKLIAYYSSYTKQKLVGLHPNVMVQRSPSHFQTGTFYWAHVRLYSTLICNVQLIFLISLNYMCSISMRKCVLLIRQLLSWVDWIYVLDGELTCPSESLT